MPVVRLLLLLVVLGGLTLLLLQNWSPVLPLVFLGGRTQALPLALWILFSVVAGALSALLISGLFKMSNYFAQSQVKRRNKVENPPPSRPQQRTVRQQYTASTTVQPPPAATSTTNDAIDDWSTDNTSNDDWSFGDTPAENLSSDSRQEPKTYEVSPPPPNTASDSVYSYTRDRNSGVGRTESIYDADYRVIKPPYGAANPTQGDDEDWGFEDDDFEDDTPTRK